MIRVSTNAGAVAEALADIGRKYPDALRRGLIDFSRGMTKYGRDAIQFGSSAALSVNLGFRAINPLTRAIQARRGRGQVAGFGGKLNQSVTAYSKGDQAFVGWPLGLRTFAESFQTADVRPFTKEQRRKFYVMGIPRALFGGKPGRGKVQVSRAESTYDRPARRVWEPMASSDGVSEYLLKKMSDRVKRIMKKRAKEAL